MRVKFRVTISDGEGERFESGVEYDVDDSRAKAWLDHKPPFVERADDEDGDPAPSRRRAPKTTAKKSSPAPDPDKGQQKGDDVKTDDKPPAKKAAAKRTAKKAATKRTAVKRAPSTAEKG